MWMNSVIKFEMVLLYDDLFNGDINDITAANPCSTA